MDSFFFKEKKLNESSISNIILTLSDKQDERVRNNAEGTWPRTEAAAVSSPFLFRWDPETSHSSLEDIRSGGCPAVIKAEKLLELMMNASLSPSVATRKAPSRLFKLISVNEIGLVKIKSLLKLLNLEWNFKGHIEQWPLKHYSQPSYVVGESENEGCSVVSDSAIPWTIQSMEFSRSKYWSG